MSPEEESDLRRMGDVQLAMHRQEFKDFRERYERDQQNLTLKIGEIIGTIKSHDEFIRDIKPIYAKGMIALGAAALGSIGIGVHWLWNHIRWNG